MASLGRWVCPHVSGVTRLLLLEINLLMLITFCRALVTPIQRPPAAQEATATTSRTSRTSTTVLPPGTAFPDTHSEQLSFVSYNVLAPLYHSLSIRDPVERQAFYQADADSRYRAALTQVARLQANMVCLQEVEKLVHSDESVEDQLRSIFSSNNTLYNAFWSPLQPRPNETVGLATVYSTDKFRLVASQSFRRGHCVWLETTDADNWTVAVANLHLPAKPSRFQGRLRATRTAVNYLQATAQADLYSVAGDMNSEPTSATVRWLTRGQLSASRVTDRGFRHKITKAQMAGWTHSLSLQSVYTDELRDRHAAVTVALRESCVMDFCLYGSGPQRSRNTVSPNGRASRRRQRRLRGGVPMLPVSAVVAARPRPWQVDTVLATLDDEDTDRNNLIRQAGLPFPDKGLFSDHLPVGAALTRSIVPGEIVNNETYDSLVAFTAPPRLPQRSNQRPRRLSRRREKEQARRLSFLSRRRHNAVLRVVSETMEQRGMTEMLRDTKLFDWPWLQGVDFSDKSRAPDLVGLLGKSLVVVEVTVSQTCYVKEARDAKERKYADLVSILQTSSIVKANNLQVVPPCVLQFTLDDSGYFLATQQPPNTLQDIKRLMKESSVLDARDSLLEDDVAKMVTQIESALLS